MFGDRKLFERSIRLMILWLSLYTSNTGLAELLYISIKARLGIFMENKFQYFILTEISSKDVIMVILENVCAEITSR